MFLTISAKLGLHFSLSSLFRLVGFKKSSGWERVSLDRQHLISSYRMVFKIGGFSFSFAHMSRVRTIIWLVKLQYIRI